MSRQNGSYYLMPICAENCLALIEHLQKQRKWKELEHCGFKMNYILHYAARLVEDPKSIRVFELLEPENLKICMFRKKMQHEEMPQLASIRLYLFMTGIAFLECKVYYGGMPIDQIISFAYNFKSAHRAEHKDHSEEGFISLYQAANNLLAPERTGAKLFFSNPSELKAQCLTYHMIHLEEADAAEKRKYLFWLRHSYHMGFYYRKEAEENAGELIYEPYPYTLWGGSREGLVCINTPTQDEGTERFLNEYQQQHLENDYHFMYLLLLHQRFAAFRYIEELASAEDQAYGELRDAAIRLKTSFVFRVISDELIYQNVYSHMYRILDVDNLIHDIDECEEKLIELHNKRTEKAEKRTQHLIAVLSLLTIFSALIDFAGWLDRFGMKAFSATLLSTVVIVLAALMSICFVWKKK